MTATDESYRHGFEDCLDLVEDIVSSTKKLKQVKDSLKVVWASMTEKKVEKIREDLGLRKFAFQEERSRLVPCQLM